MKNCDRDHLAEHLLVVMPSWVGDTVMATPTLRSLRQQHPRARITALVRNTVRSILDPCPWLDRVITIRPRRKGRTGSGRRGMFGLSRRLAAGNFDTAVLLPNSFRSALLVRMAGIARRVGYDRDGRGFLLTDRLLPRRQGRAFVPVPTHDYYLGLARYLGATDPDPTMQLFTRPEQDAKALAILGPTVLGDRPLILITPGATYGDAKLWHADRFAQVADRCVRQLGAVVAVSGAPKERRIIQAVIDAACEPIVDLTRHGIDPSLLKSVVALSRLLITNDTGPRHIAAAMGVPVITIFGPTDPAWTQIGFSDERQLQARVECGPCQLKKCPLDHRCMDLIEADSVFEAAAQLLGHVGKPGVAAMGATEP